jgi:hypothetical protein
MGMEDQMREDKHCDGCFPENDPCEQPKHMLPVIPLFKGRPDRRDPISKQEVTDLSIDVNTKIKTVKDFLELVS